MDKDADFVHPETGDELDWDDFDWSFGSADHDDFFEDCCLSTGEYDWAKHDDLLDAYNTAGDAEDSTLEAIKAYLDANCSPSYFGQAYRGQYRDGAAFAEQEFSELIEGREHLQYLVIDWDATWQQMHDYVEYGDGYFFRNV